MEEEQRGIPSHAVLGADFIVLRAVHLDCSRAHTHTHKKKTLLTARRHTSSVSKFVLYKRLLNKSSGGPSHDRHPVQQQGECVQKCGRQIDGGQFQNDSIPKCEISCHVCMTKAGGATKSQF